MIPLDAFQNISLIELEHRIKGMSGGSEIYILREYPGFLCSGFTIHCAVFPFDREWSLVPDEIQCADNFFKVDIPVSEAAEVPVAVGMTECYVSAEYSGRFRSRTPVYIFHVDMEYSFREAVDKFNVIDSLVSEVAGVVIESE